MSGRGRMTRAEQQQQTRRRLVEAATELFATHGFEGATIDAITERAGYTRGAFYSNFSSKEDLLLAISDARMERFNEQVMPRLPGVEQHATPAGDDPLSAMGDAIDAAARWLIAESQPVEPLLLIELARIRDNDERADEAITRFLEHATDLAAQVLETAGIGDDTPTRRRLARAVIALITGVQVTAHLELDHDSDTVALLLRGILRTALDESSTGGSA